MEDGEHTAHHMSMMIGHRMLERLLKTNDDVQSHRREAVEQENIDEQSKVDGRAWRRVADGLDFVKFTCGEAESLNRPKHKAAG